MMISNTATMPFTIAMRMEPMAFTTAMMHCPMARKTDSMQEITAPIFAIG